MEKTRVNRNEGREAITMSAAKRKRKAISRAKDEKKKRKKEGKKRKGSIVGEARAFNLSYLRTKFDVRERVYGTLSPILHRRLGER